MHATVHRGLGSCGLVVLLCGGAAEPAHAGVRVCVACDSAAHVLMCQVEMSVRGLAWVVGLV